MDAACITNETWQDYAAGRLDEPARDRVLLHAASCPVCSDILQGIDLMAQPASLEQEVKRIHTEIDLRTASPRMFRMNRTWYAAAAILIMMGGIGWYLFNTAVEQPVALRQQPEPVAEQPKTVQEKQEVIRSKDQPAASATKPTIPKQQKESIQEKPAPTIIMRKKPIMDIGEDKLASRSVMSTTDASISEPAAGTEAERNVESSSEAITIQDASRKKTAAKKSKEIYPSAYNANNNSSLNSTTDAVTTVPDSLSYQRALTYFNTMHYDSCRLSLSPVVSNSSSLYYEDGLMLSAKTALAQNDRRTAIADLKKVRKLKGKRAAEADTLLKTLK